MGLVLLGLGASQSYVFGVSFPTFRVESVLRLGVNFVTLKGKSVFLRLGVIFLTFGG